MKCPCACILLKVCSDSNLHAVTVGERENDSLLSKHHLDCFLISMEQLRPWDTLCMKESSFLTCNYASRMYLACMECLFRFWTCFFLFYWTCSTLTTVCLELAKQSFSVAHFFSCMPLAVGVCLAKIYLWVHLWHLLNPGYAWKKRVKAGRLVMKVYIIPHTYCTLFHTMTPCDA
jgi:hypothetical protein